jgi:hypothetical protein
MRVKTGNVVMRVAFKRQKVIPRSLENRNFCKREIRNVYHLCVQGTEYMNRNCKFDEKLYLYELKQVCIL